MSITYETILHAKDAAKMSEEVELCLQCVYKALPKRSVQIDLVYKQTVSILEVLGYAFEPAPQALSKSVMSSADPSPPKPYNHFEPVEAFGGTISW